MSVTLLISKHLFEQTNVQGFTKHGVRYSPFLNRHRCRSIEMINKNTSLKYYFLRNKSYCKNLNSLCVCQLQVLYPNTIIIFNKINSWSIRVCSCAIRFSEVLVNRLEDTTKKTLEASSAGSMLLMVGMSPELFDWQVIITLR